jgi:outer membrane protein insertion porin family
MFLSARAAHAVGEIITDVRVLDNDRTDEATVRSIAGVTIGDTLEVDTLDTMRERLNTSGLFADVNVWWETFGAGVRVNISVKDKFPWAPVPIASWSSNNKSIGLVFVHGNLFGRGKQFLLGARYATIDSGATLAYRDPSLFGSWAYWQLLGVIQRQVIPEYQSYGDTPAGTPVSLSSPFEFRETRLFSYGFEPSVGVAWLRRVRTQVAWHLENFSYFSTPTGSDDPNNDPPHVSLPGTTNKGRIGVARASIAFDFRAREFAVMTGGSLGGSIDFASPDFGSDFTYWRLGAGYEQGIRFFHSHNLIFSVGGLTGHNLPFWAEATAGGPNLRGYLSQQFRGDTMANGKVEYHFPLFSMGSLDVRMLGFYDVAAVWFRELPTAPPGTLTQPDANGYTYVIRNTADMRSFPTVLQQGFDVNRNVHNDVGAGLRFFLRSVAVPLVGIDFGYALESHGFQYLIVIGA